MTAADAPRSSGDQGFESRGGLRIAPPCVQRGLAPATGRRSDSPQVALVQSATARQASEAYHQKRGSRSCSATCCGVQNQEATSPAAGLVGHPVTAYRDRPLGTVRLGDCTRPRRNLSGPRQAVARSFVRLISLRNACRPTTNIGIGSQEGFHRWRRCPSRSGQPEGRTRFGHPETSRPQRRGSGWPYQRGRSESHPREA